MLNALNSIAPIPKGIEVERSKKGAFECVFLKAGRKLLAKGESEAFKLKGLARYLALRKRWVWSYPQFGKRLSELPGPQAGNTGMWAKSDGTQFLLWERNDGTSCLLLPLVDGGVRATLQSAGEGLRLIWNWESEGEVQDEANLAALAIGRDPVRLVQLTMSLVAERLKTFRLRAGKGTPSFINYLGWCTWDAFYREVDEKKALSGLASFAKGGIAPGFMVLDDGWQDVDKEEMLLSFNANREKFPHGLKGLVEKAKGKYGVKLFGVWHAFEGYWRGVNPQGPLGSKYPIIKNHRVDPPSAGQTENRLTELNLIAPEEASRFYNDFHFELRKAGVDMVKIDNQSGLDVFTEGKLGRVSSMRLYQEALQGSTQNYFLGNCVSCMSNGSDVFFNMMSANVMRNTNDYFPKKDVAAQQTHVFYNAMNAIWFSTFTIPDWDMFQTHGPCAEFHAAARALSGGPIYVCDKPGKQNFSIIRKLCVSGSRVLRFDDAALPLPECVYVDLQTTPAALKIVNRRGAIAALGLFNCHRENTLIKTSFKPSDIAFLSGRDFAVYLHNAGRAVLAKTGTAVRIELEARGWEIATISPFDRGIAPLGLADKYAGAAALISWKWIGKDAFSCELADGGRTLFMSQRKPKAVMSNKRNVSFHYDKTGLLSVETPEGGPCETEILF